MNVITKECGVDQHVRGSVHEFVERRYWSGLKNFFYLYIPIAHTWLLYDNSAMYPRLVASRISEKSIEIKDQKTWNAIQEIVK